MPVILRESGLRFIIYVDDHLPAHVHIEGKGGNAKIAIEDAGLIWSRNLSRQGVLRAVDVVEIHRAELRIAWQKSMASLTDADLDAAERRGSIVHETEPHARTARYDRISGLLVIELTNGATYSLPARYLQGFADATDDQIAKVHVDSGYGLHWDELDADFTVGGLLAGRFGNASHMAELRKREQHAA